MLSTVVITGLVLVLLYLAYRVHTAEALNWQLLLQRVNVEVRLVEATAKLADARRQSEAAVALADRYATRLASRESRLLLPASVDARWATEEELIRG